MGINTDLNVSPYFDDFDETKQFHRVLFKAAIPVQARELTQLQSVLQNQIERFGTNIFKEGTTISGADLYEIEGLSYIKLDDNLSGLPDGTTSITQYTPRYATEEDVQTSAQGLGNIQEGDYITFTIVGSTSR